MKARLYVVSVSDEIASEVAVFAETAKAAVAQMVTGPFGDVPDEWYDSDVEINSVEVGGYTVYGPYEQEKR